MKNKYLFIFSFLILFISTYSCNDKKESQDYNNYPTKEINIENYSFQFPAFFQCYPDSNIPTIGWLVGNNIEIKYGTGYNSINIIKDQNEQTDTSYKRIDTVFITYVRKISYDKYKDGSYSIGLLFGNLQDTAHTFFDSNKNNYRFYSIGMHSKNLTFNQMKLLLNVFENVKIISKIHKIKNNTIPI